MSKQNIETSGLTLAKGTQLKGDDFFEVKVMENITVAVVCDGVGSALQGAQAAKHTTAFLINSLKNRPKSWTMEKSIKHFIENINRVLYLDSMLEYDREELVTTLALVVIEGDRLYGANVGDSRIYLHRNIDGDEQLTRLSEDHSMDDEGMENVLISAMGLEESVSPYYFENNLLAGDKILLCSDGLYNELSEGELSSGMKMGASFLVKKASKLYDDNLPDDTTAIVLEGGILLAALVHDLWAARREVAAFGWVCRARHISLQDDTLALAFDHRVRDRHGGEQRLRVRVHRLFIEFVAFRQLNNLAQVHHSDTVGNVTNHRQVMRNEQVGQVELFLQVFEQVDDLRLDRHIERRDRLVADDKRWVDCQGARNADTLALTAGELVRVAVDEVGIEANDLEQLLHPILALFFGRANVVNFERFADDAADGHARVERGVGILKDHLHAAAHLAQLLAFRPGQIFTLEDHFTRCGTVQL